MGFVNHGKAKRGTRQKWEGPEAKMTGEQEKRLRWALDKNKKGGGPKRTKKRLPEVLKNTDCWKTEVRSETKARGETLDKSDKAGKKTSTIEEERGQSWGDEAVSAPVAEKWESGHPRRNSALHQMKIKKDLYSYCHIVQERGGKYSKRSRRSSTETVTQKKRAHD